jgi:uncharacterized delta-60 repeat protein
MRQVGDVPSSRRHFGRPVVLCVVLALSLAVAARAAGGDLDPTFDADGKVTTRFAGGAGGRSVAIQSDGMIVVAGEAAGRFGLARYDADGELDSTFGGDGKVTTDFTDGLDWANGVAIQADGKIVAVGHANFRRFAIARYKTNGTLDTSFGGDGMVRTDFNAGTDIAHGVVIQDDGKIVVVGTADKGKGNAFALARYGTNGRLDRTFGGDGRVTTQFQGIAGTAYGVALQTNGKIVAVGEGTAGGGFALARYRVNGSLDPRFSGDGMKVTHFSGSYGGGARSVALQPDGKIVAAGTAGDIFGPFALARYTARGRLDPTFGGDGRVTANVDQGEESAMGVAIQANGRIVAVGYSGVPHEVGDPGDGEFALVRVRANGALDSSFGGNGKVRTRFSIGLALALGVALQQDGAIVAAGWAGGRFGLARYLS